MFKNEVIAFFGEPGAVSKIAQALGISRAAVSKWPDLIPEGSAYKLESITDRKLRVDARNYPPQTKESQFA